MAVSKRLRYEILRRDNTDDPSNLVTACQDCNNGKSATNPDQPLVDDVAADALRWAHAMQLAADAQVHDLEQAAAWHDAFDARWTHWTINGEPVDRPSDWRTTVDQFRAAGLPEPVLHDAVRIAMEAPGLPNDRVWRYFCGVGWRRVEQIRADALAAVRADAPPSDDITIEETLRAEWLGIIREATLTIGAALDTGQTARLREITTYLLGLSDYQTACGHTDGEQCTDRCNEIWTAMGRHRPQIRQHLAELTHQPVGWPATTTGRCA